MELLAAIGGMSFVLASLVMGFRLLWLARRTRELPEFAIGLALFLMGGFGYPLVSVARLATGIPEGPRVALFLLSILFNLVGTLAVCVFNWRVFRPTQRWAPGLTLVFSGAVTVALGLQSVAPGVAAAALHNEGTGYHLFMALLGTPIAWAAFESLRYHSLLRKRERLGLADPVVVNRILLWGAGMLSAFVISIVSSTLAFSGVDVATTPVGALVIAPLGLLAAACVWLAFLPPAAYTRRFSERASPS